jgi:heme/copper-type cytochrome/quinol oxidase subunit 2
MKTRTAVLLTLALLIAALAPPAMVYFRDRPSRIRTIRLEAHRYGYTPNRIVVNQGDTIIFQPTSRDVTMVFCWTATNSNS